MPTLKSGAGAKTSSTSTVAGRRATAGRSSVSRRSQRVGCFWWLVKSTPSFSAGFGTARGGLTATSDERSTIGSGAGGGANADGFFRLMRWGERSVARSSTETAVGPGCSAAATDRTRLDRVGARSGETLTALVDFFVFTAMYVVKKLHNYT